MNEDARQPDSDQADSHPWEMPDAIPSAPPDGEGDPDAPPDDVGVIRQDKSPMHVVMPSAPDRGSRQVLPPVAVIHLGRGDDMAAVLAKLRAVPQGRAVLVVPGGSRLLRREIDVARLRRWAATHGFGVALVSGDPQVRSVARRYGLPASGSIGAARGKARPLQPERARRAPSAGRQAVRTLYGARRSWEDGLLLLILVVGAGLIGVIGAFFLMPEATVTVMPAGMALERQVHLIANPAVELVDEEAAEIPAHVVETELKGQAQVSTLARSDAPDAKATGEVVFINRTNESVEIPAGTVVATSAGTTIKFVTTETTSLAAGMTSTARARIEALDPGPSGNVGPFLINRVADPALTAKVRVANEQPTEGGSVKQVGVVTAAERERLRGMLLQQLHQEALARLGSALGPEEFMPVESISVVALDETYDHLLGEATDFLGMTMRVHAEGIAFDLSQAQRIARAALEDEVPGGHTLQPESFHAEVVEATVIAPNPDEGQYTVRAELVMKVRGRTEATITPGRVISLIQGRPLSEARMRLLSSLPLKEAPQLSMEPDWWGRVPWLPFRIQVIIISGET
jgi:hypothetical protein